MNNIYIYTAPFLINYSAKIAKNRQTNKQTNKTKQKSKTSYRPTQNIQTIAYNKEETKAIKFVKICNAWEHSSVQRLKSGHQWVLCSTVLEQRTKKALSAAEATVQLWIWIQLGETNHLLSAVYHALVCARSRGSQCSYFKKVGKPSTIFLCNAKD